MTPLKPGFVPHGWERGQAIFIMKPEPGMLGHIYGGVPVKHNWNTPPDASIIGRIDFDDRDTQDVNAWVKWWRGSDQITGKP